MQDSLQAAFIRSKGQSVVVNGHRVHQLDIIPIDNGIVTVRFLNSKNNNQGVRLKSNAGWIMLSNGSRVPIVDTWYDPELPSSVSHTVYCPDHVLKIWNIYRNHHSNGSITEDMFTGNAGMIIRSSGDEIREYSCSSGPGDFSPSDLVFELQWKSIK